jgi:hypothetical protein
MFEIVLQNSEGFDTYRSTRGSTQSTTLRSTQRTTLCSTQGTTLRSTQRTTLRSTQGTTLRSTQRTTLRSTQRTTLRSTLCYLFEILNITNSHRVKKFEDPQEEVSHMRIVFTYSLYRTSQRLPHGFTYARVAYVDQLFC